MFQRVGSLISSMPTRSRVPETLVALQVRQAAKEILDRVLAEYPQDFAKKVKVKTFKNGALTIIAPQLMSAELHARSEGLKKDINGVLGKKFVKEIKFRNN